MVFRLVLLGVLLSGSAFPVSIDYQVQTVGVVDLLGSEMVDLEGASGLIPDPDSAGHSGFTLFNLVYTSCNLSFGCNDGVTGSTSSFLDLTLNSTITYTVHEGSAVEIFSDPFSFHISDEGGRFNGIVASAHEVTGSDSLGLVFDVTGIPPSGGLPRPDSGPQLATSLGFFTGQLDFGHLSVGLGGLSFGDFPAPNVSSAPEPTSYLLAAIPLLAIAVAEIAAKKKLPFAHLFQTATQVFR